MNVETSESMSEVWTMWQGHVVNGVYPLGRYLGCSDHSGVFVTKLGAQSDTEVALKLIPAGRGLSEVLLPCWKRVAGLAQPHLLPLLDSGECQLDGLPYLYVVMEYADQTLAQLLQHRALTDDEAREMLVPILEVLTYLHGRNLILGQLKPTNVLVVGDQLKLASDTVHLVGEGATSTNALTAFDPPEAGAGSTASDIWALGISLLEGLAPQSAVNLGAHRDSVTLPMSFSRVFHDTVARCLSTKPQDRPSVADLVAWSQGSALPLPSAIAAPEIPEPKTPEVAAPVIAPTVVVTDAAPLLPTHVISAVALPASSNSKTKKPRTLAVAILGVVGMVALGLIAAHVFSSRSTSVTPAEIADTVVAAPVPAPLPAPTEAPAPVSSAANPSGSEVATSSSALHEVIPDVSQRLRRSIRGHVIVSVRVSIDPDGSVSSATADKMRGKKSLQKLAVDAAKKWTFSPMDNASKRLMQIQFDFTRDGTTGHAMAVR